MPDTLTRRQLNRSLLERQWLLERQSRAPTEAIARLVALQSQIPNPPYIGLWTRLQAFAKSDLSALLESRDVVRAPWIRSTLHLVTAPDHQRFQAVIQPALARGLRSFFGKRAANLDIERLIRIAKPFIEAEQPTIGALREHLLAHEPQRDKFALAYAVRSHLPLVQVPPSGFWGAGSRATYTTAEAWLGAAEPADLTALFRRYLAAYGPASVMDFQTWTGMTGLKSRLAEATKTLVAYRSEDGGTLHDLPGLPIPPGDRPAPVRFLPEYDNILIAHKGRRRVIPERHRKKVFVSAGRVLGTALIDGFVGGIWKARRVKGAVEMTVTLFEDADAETMAELEREGLALLRFIEDEADTYSAQIIREG